MCLTDQKWKSNTLGCRCLPVVRSVQQSILMMLRDFFLQSGQTFQSLLWHHVKMAINDPMSVLLQSIWDDKNSTALSPKFYCDWPGPWESPVLKFNRRASQFFQIWCSVTITFGLWEISSQAIIKSQLIELLFYAGHNFIMMIVRDG